MGDEEGAAARKATAGISKTSATICSLRPKGKRRLRIHVLPPRGCSKVSPPSALGWRCRSLQLHSGASNRDGNPSLIS
jgi:hypothetical protein